MLIWIRANVYKKYKKNKIYNKKLHLNHLYTLYHVLLTNTIITSSGNSRVGYPYWNGRSSILFFRTYYIVIYGVKTNAFFPLFTLFIMIHFPLFIQFIQLKTGVYRTIWWFHEVDQCSHTSILDLLWIITLNIFNKFLGK